MKKIKLPVLFFTAILFIGCSGQDTNMSSSSIDEETQELDPVMPQNYWEKSFLKGNVKSVVNIMYHPVPSNGDFISGEVYDSEDGNVKVTMNKKGYVIETIYYLQSLEPNRTEISTMHELGYNTGSEIYDSQNVLFAIHEIEFDNQGRPIKLYTKNPQGITMTTGTSTYDENGHVLGLELTGTDNEVFWSMENTYNELGLISTKTIYGENNQFISRETMRYDEDQNHIETTFEFPEPLPAQTGTYKYEFDNQGNWVKKTIFNSDGNALQIIERTIEYF